MGDNHLPGSVAASRKVDRACRKNAAVCSQFVAAVLVDFPFANLIEWCNSLRHWLRDRHPVPATGGVVRRLHVWRKATLFAISLFLFILAILLMKEGARGLGPLVRDVFHVTNPANALGFGWVFAYVVMSGSPVAAAALTLLDAGVIDAMSTFTMVTGSRLGSSFFVLLLGFVYVLRGRNRAASLGMGLLALIVTGITHLTALPLGIALLRTGVLDGVQRPRGARMTSVLESVLDPVVAALMAVLPPWTLFPVGLLIILLSFSLFDRCLPQIHVGEGQMGRMSRLVFRPWIMFALGGLVTLITLSVSVSLSILVPLSHRGYVRRENVIPYIMGAGVTTFVDTLLAAVLLANSVAFAVVLAQMVSVALASAAFLAVRFGLFERLTLGIAAWASASTRNVTLFVLSIVGVPLLLLLV